MEPALGGMVQNLFDHLLPRAAGDGAGTAQSLEALLERYGFDRVQHEQIRADLRAGRIGLAQNRLPASSTIEDARPEDVCDATRGLLRIACAARAWTRWPPERWLWSRWPAAPAAAGRRGAGVVKALNPFARLGGRHRSFLDVHLAKSRRIGRLCGTAPAHVVTTSYLTHEPSNSGWC